LDGRQGGYVDEPLELASAVRSLLYHQGSSLSGDAAPAASTAGVEPRVEGSAGGSSLSTSLSGDGPSGAPAGDRS
jgi:hypothetical protein